MQKADYPEFAATLAHLAVIFRTDVNEAQLKAYWFALSEFHIEQVTEAAKKLILTKKIKTMPLPAELLEAIKPDDIEYRSVMAFQSVCNTVEIVGIYGDPAFKDDNIIRTIRALGGWVDYCMKTRDTDQFEFLRKDFIKTYKVIASQPRCGELPKLLGLHSQGREKLFIEQDTRPPQKRIEEST